MGLNVLLESDNPDRFHLSRGLKHHFERLLSPLLYIIARAIFFYLGQCHVLGAHNNKCDKVLYSITKIRYLRY